jgi:hypothetical protein
MMRPRLPDIVPVPAPEDYSDDDALITLVEVARAVCNAPATGTDPVRLLVPRRDLQVLRVVVGDFTGEDDQ